MARDLNQVIVIGRLVRNPEIKYTASGVPITKFSIANNVSFMQNKELKEYVNYFDVNVWGNQAINCEKYLKKGSQVAITGSLRQNRWNDKSTGQTRSKVEITAMSVQFLNASSEKKQGPINVPEETPPWGEDDQAGEIEPLPGDIRNDDDIPF